MRIMTKQLLTLLLTFSIYSATFAGEGMWLPQLLKALNEGEMQTMGMKLSAEDIYSVNQGSLKDAIVHFGGFCTSEIISPNGLLLTNHHCGYSNIQSHTTLENNYLKNGFWAKNHGEEIPNPGLFARMIVRIEDVSEAVLNGVTDDMSEADRQSTIDKNINAVEGQMQLEKFQEVMTRPFFKGNQYFSFVTVTYNDVRLVGTPPDAIGKFGADTDNWVWPRHTGDFSLFRIYAGPDNQPAEYAPDNQPYQPKHFLPISMSGVEEGDFTLIFGFPGRTNEYLPSYAIEEIVEITNPIRIGMRDQTLDILDKAMRASEKTRIQYASKQSRISNAWKKWQGENLGIQKTGGIQKKQNYEKAFEEALAKNELLNKKYSYLLPEFKRLYESNQPYAAVDAYYRELTGSNIELMRMLSVFNRLVGAYENNGATAYQDLVGRVEGYTETFFKNYDVNIDQQVFTALMETYLTNIDGQYTSALAKAKLKIAGNDYHKMAEQLYNESIFSNHERVATLLKKNPAEAVEMIKYDVAYQLYQDIKAKHKDTVTGPAENIKNKLSKLQRTYMKALMEAFPDQRFYPDANSTMRVTYGQVKSYEPRDAVRFEPQTYLSGVMEKYVPGDYEFDVPAKLIELYEAKDYGQYGEDGDLPVCFIGSNHTTGGNSGSPAIDAEGNLIGLNFDRAWEGTMSDINYDASICRNIMVDIRYVLFIIDKYAGAGHLVEEMKLVRQNRK